jgi:cytosine/adenosine deaminase-related metal-dependent hydrolase
MLTLSGAEALGFGAEAGSLEAGKSADLAVLPLADDEPTDPYELIFNAETPVQAVLCRGAWIHGNVLKTTGN